MEPSLEKLSRDDSQVCAGLTDLSTTNTIVSIILLLGILISYLVQHHRIITLRSSRGISPFWILLGETSATCAFANILVTPASQVTFGCCAAELGPWTCFVNLLGVAQIGVQWGSFTVILALFLIYYPRATTPLDPESASQPPYRTAVLITLISIIHIVVVAIISIILFTLPSTSSELTSRSQTWANILGVSAALLASIQYIPQIWTTWRLKAVGSLSIPMMCLQTPGGFLWAGSLAARLGWQGWSTWSIFLVSATLQGVLLAMAVVFEVRMKREGLDRDVQVARGVDETSALLADGDREENDE